MIDLLTKAAATAFTAIRASHPDERFYFFALYTTEEGDYVCATAWSEEALMRVASEYREQDPHREVEALARSLRFSAPDSPYHDVHGEEFSSFDAGPELHDACFLALQRLDRKGFFGRSDARSSTIVNVVYGDMSDERWLEHAKRLNSADVVESAIPFLRLHIPSGAVSCWGAGVYQVNALSLSADRSIVAYSGSGGEVGILRLLQRKPIYEKRRRNGQHWACALSADGARLYLGDHDGVGILNTWTGKYTSFVKTAKPGTLALSPDGTRLAVGSWERPIAVFETATGNLLWESGAKNATLAFSPDGRWLAAASAKWDEKWVASATCYEASTGHEVWTSPLGDGDTACIAWSPDGEEVCGSASEWAFVSDSEPVGNASLSFFASTTGQRLRTVPWQSGIDALAIAPGGERIALCARGAIVVLKRDGSELARGNGAHESLLDCAFIDDDTVIAVGRDVNGGPAILSLSC